MENRHYSDVIIGTMASQITSLMIVYSTGYSGADQRKHQSSPSLAFVRGIYGWPVDSPHIGPVTRKMFPFDDVIMVNEMRHGAVTVTLPRHTGNIRQVILQWRHNEPYDISNHQHIDCLLKRLFWGTSKKTSKLRVTGLYKGNPPVTGGFPSQRASNPKNISFDDVIIYHPFIWLVLSFQLKLFNTYLSTKNMHGVVTTVHSKLALQLPLSFVSSYTATSAITSP